MSNDTPRCEDGPICDREFAPTKNGNVCIRDGHAAECHEDKVAVIDQRPYVFQPPAHPKIFRVCFWKRDDKTAATCREKFDNFGQYVVGEEPHIPWPSKGGVLTKSEARPPWHKEDDLTRAIADLERPVHRLGCSIFRKSTCDCMGSEPVRRVERSSTEKHWRTMPPLSAGMGLLPKRTPIVHALNLGESSQPSIPIVYGRPPYENRDFPHMGYLGATLEAWCSRQAEWRSRVEPLAGGVGCVHKFENYVGKLQKCLMCGLDWRFTPEGLAEEAATPGTYWNNVTKDSREALDRGWVFAQDDLPSHAVSEMQKWFDDLLVGNLRAREPQSETDRGRRESNLAKLYNAVRSPGPDLKGFRLTRIVLRSGEWERLCGDLIQYPDERSRDLQPWQVGSTWVDILQANVPIIEHPFLPVEMGGHRVICMLQYEHVDRFWSLPRMRIITE